MVLNSKDLLLLPHCGPLNDQGRCYPAVKSSAGPSDSNSSLLRLQCGQLFWLDLKCPLCLLLLTSSCVRLYHLFLLSRKSCSSGRWTGLLPLASWRWTFAQNLSFSLLSLLVPWLESPQWMITCSGTARGLYCLGGLSGCDHDRGTRELLLRQINRCRYQQSMPSHLATRRH